MRFLYAKMLFGLKQGLVSYYAAINGDQQSPLRGMT